MQNEIFPLIIRPITLSSPSVFPIIISWTRGKIRVNRSIIIPWTVHTYSTYTFSGLLVSPPVGQLASFYRSTATNGPGEIYILSFMKNCTG